MSDSEGEDIQEEMINTVQTLIQGCENFVVKNLEEETKKALNERNEMKKMMSEACREVNKSAEDMMEKVRKHFVHEIKDLEQRSSMNESRLQKMIADKDEIIETHTKEINALKDRPTCQCKSMYVECIKAGSNVFGKDVLLDILDMVPQQEDPSVSIQPIRGDEMDSAQSYQEEPRTAKKDMGADISDDQESPMVATPLFPRKVETTSLPSSTAQTVAPSAMPEIKTTLLGAKIKKEQGKIIKKLEDLPEALIGVKQFYRTTPMATKEKLCPLQKAYFRYFMANCDRKKSLNEKAMLLREKGIKDRIWTRTYCPPHCKDFVTYLKQRIKNEQMQLKLQSVKQMSANQEERLKEMKEKKKQNKDGQNDKE